MDAIFKNVNPTLFDLSGLGTESGIYDEHEQFVFPPAVRLTRTSMESTPWVLLDDGFSLYLYILKCLYKRRKGQRAGGLRGRELR